MAALGIVDARINPNDSSQRVELWGNGRIDTFNCPPITAGPPSDWFVRLDLPVAVAIWVIDWNTTAGYVLDGLGGFWPINGAPNIATSKPDWFDGINMIVPGVPYQKSPIFKDWSWDPNNPGRGVVLDGYGTLHEFGGAPQPPRALHRWTQSTIARKLVINWGTGTAASMKAYTLDYAGGIHHDYAAAEAPGYTRLVTAQPKQAGDIPYWLRTDAARDLVITDWVGTPAGYTLHKSGSVHAWGGAEPAIGYPRGSGDWARKLLLVNAGNPSRFRLIGTAGQSHEWVASTPPTVTPGGFIGTPVNPTTDTSRPVLAWSYTDAQQDDQAHVLVLVFTQAFVNTHDMSDPYAHARSALVWEETHDPDTRGIQCSVDLENGSYRLYVAAGDTAGQWSPWVSRAWTQNVPLPATPTGLTATADDDAATVALSVTAATGGIADLIRFEASDDAGATWMPVRGADAVPLAATTIAVDQDVPLGVIRTYRAVAFSYDPRTASLPSSTAAARVGSLCYRLTAVVDPVLGGEIRAAGPLEWTRPVSAGVFDGLGSDFPTVVSDGASKARRGTLSVTVVDRSQWLAIKALAEADSVLLLRDPFGEAIYCRIVGDWSQRLLEAAPLAGERAQGLPIRHMHSVSLPLVEVRPPHLPA